MEKEKTVKKPKKAGKVLGRIGLVLLIAAAVYLLVYLFGGPVF